MAPTFDDGWGCCALAGGTTVYLDAPCCPRRARAGASYTSMMTMESLTEQMEGWVGFGIVGEQPTESDEFGYSVTHIGGK